MAYLGTTPNTGENRKLDDISGSFNGSTTTFDLQVDSSDIYPGAATALLISVGGVIQEPKTAYSLHSNGKQITFSTAPSTGEDFFGLVLGQAIDVATPADDSVTTAKIADNAVTAIKLADPLGFANVSGNVSIGRSLAVGYTDGKVPAANLEVKGNVALGGSNFVMQTAGNIGIGTASPAARLDVTSGEIRMTTGRNIQWGGTNVRIQGTHTSNLFEVFTGGAVKMVVNAGKVGIGTSSPGEALEVYRNAATTHARIKINNPHADSYSSELTLTTNSRSWNIGAGDDAIGVDASGDFHIYDATAAAYRMAIKSDGKIGIGTTSPASVLDVNGTILASSNTYATAQGSITLDYSTTQNFVLTFIANVTFANPSTEQVGQAGIFVIKQGASGGPYTLSLGTDYETAGSGGITLSTGANDVDIIPYFVKASGQILLGAVQKDFG